MANNLIPYDEYYESIDGLLTGIVPQENFRRLENVGGRSPNILDANYFFNVIPQSKYYKGGRTLLADFGNGTKMYVKNDSYLDMFTYRNNAQVNETFSFNADYKYFALVQARYNNKDYVGVVMSANKNLASNDWCLLLDCKYYNIELKTPPKPTVEFTGNPKIDYIESGDF